MSVPGNSFMNPDRDLIGYGRHVPKISWPDGARVALSVVVNYEEGSEYSYPDGFGKNDGLAELAYDIGDGYRDLCVESVYEYGSRAGIWRIQRIIDELGIPVTIFGCALAFERNPAVAEWVRDSQHEACCHGFRWEEVWRLTRDEEREHMKAAIESFRETVGERPLGWYCRYGPSINTRDLVVEEGGFVYDSDAYNDDLPYYVSVRGIRHLVVPYSLTYNDARFVTPQGYTNGTTFVDDLKRGLDFLREEGATHPRMMSIGLHPRLIGQASRASALKEFLAYALEMEDVWFARRIDIANWWNAQHGE